jgi:O-antigen ligase
VGFPRPGEPQFERTLFTSSGRVDAWRGALRQALERPLLGYGFGTEERVFVDRYYLHYSSVPENAYLGTLLQLGFVGLLVLLAVLAFVVARVRFAKAPLAAVCAGAVACGLLLAFSQSYLTSAGSPATTPFWLFALLLVGATTAEAARRLGERDRDEGEVQAAERDAEPRLDVMRREEERVREQEHHDGAGGAPARQRER